MDKRLENIIDKHSSDYEKWTTLLNKYIQNQYSNTEIPQNEAIDQIYDIVNILAELAESCIGYGNFKDTFEYDNFSQNFYGPELEINSKKTGTIYYLGLNEKGLYIRTYLKHNFSLKNMDDKFWLNLLSLYNYGEFELIEDEHFGKEIRKKHPELFNNQKGIIFRLFRKYFVSLLTGDDTFDKKYIIGSLGDLQVSWNSSFGLDKIVEECCEVFKALYKLNYELWKIEDVKLKVKKSSR